MNKELHRILMELDNKFDIELKEYFSLPEEWKKELTDCVVEYYLPLLKTSDSALENLLFAYETKLEEAIERESFEEADMYKRIMKTLQDINSFNEEDWKQAQQ
jgi:hypothetical protein